MEEEIDPVFAYGQGYEVEINDYSLNNDCWRGDHYGRLSEDWSTQYRDDCGRGILDKKYEDGWFWTSNKKAYVSKIRKRDYSWQWQRKVRAPKKSRRVLKAEKKLRLQGKTFRSFEDVYYVPF